MAEEQLYFSIKTKNAETVDKILNREDNIEFDGINVLEELLIPGRIIFIVLGGDKPAWETGLMGIGILTKAPYDKGYSGKNFKVQVSIKLLMQHPIKREDLVPYRDTYGTIGIAPITKWEPNQALSQIPREKAIALFRAMLEIDKSIEGDLDRLIGQEGMKEVKGSTTMMIEVPTHYGESEKQAVERYILNIDKADVDLEERNKRLFKLWFNRLILPEGDSNAGEPYKESSINAYIQVINSIKIDVDGTEKTLFASTDVDLVQKHIETEQANDQSKGRRVSALKKYRQFLLDRGADEDMSEFIPLVYNTSLETKFELNRIVFGAPGTGKSHGLKKDSIELLENNTIGGFERVTFHPDYTYSQFVGTYKPVMDGNEKIRYKFVAGPFMRVYVEALRSARTDNPQPYLLLVEEINRAKVAAVFGDVFQLLDRDDDGVSEYEIQPSEDIQKYLAEKLGGSPENYDRIQIPNNMFIWATMNSADQGVFPMDTAFKRRWNFEYLGINENEEKISGFGKIQLAGTEEPVEWNMLRRAINAKMSSNDFKINEDKLMGPFFLSTKIITSDENGMIIDTKKFVDAFKSKVIMYLYEDAVKQGKHRFFEGCDSSKYSSVCDAFDEKGMGIFGPNFEETFYGK
jgi:hypothetical protein